MVMRTQSARCLLAIAAAVGMTTSLLAQTVPVSVDRAGGFAPRKLAEGVLTVIPPDPQPEETSLGPLDLEFVAKHPELEWKAPDFENGQPNFSSSSETLLAQGRGVTLRHPVFALEFAFKPMRMIEMELPDAEGVRQSQLVHYLLYRVRYLGNDLLPEQERVEAGTGIPKEPARTVADSVLFVPRFTWISTQQKQEIPEKILPLVKGPIAARERVGKPLLDSFEMIRKIQKTTPEANNEYWGVATWTGIDPSIDFFAIQVEGLTNAYRIVEAEGNRKFEKKRLQINFWRPGDGIASEEDRIRLGAPAFEQQDRVEYALRQLGLKERLDYLWIYR